VTTCERCGADTLDARGHCATCGWQVPFATLEEDESSPSLGETRAAVVPDAEPWTARSALQSASGDRFGQTASMPPNLQRSPSSPKPPAHTLLRSAPPAGASARYCGVCGARISADEVFCGQCGTPVGMPSGDYATVNGPEGSRRYADERVDQWAPVQHDELTEAYALAAPSGYGYGGSGRQYRPAGYASGYFNTYTQQVSSGARNVRIVVGILCLAGSLVSAAAAIVLAIH
jgi:hypothetical protein